VKDLARYLLQHLVVDFSGQITTEKVREFLRKDDSREARVLLSKVIEDKGVDDLLVVVADCLKDYISVGITDEVIRDQLNTYAES